MQLGSSRGSSETSLATQQDPYFIGKPDPLMMRHAMKRLGTSIGVTVIIGDLMDEDNIAGTENGIVTVLVFPGEQTSSE